MSQLSDKVKKEIEKEEHLRLFPTRMRVRRL